MVRKSVIISIGYAFMLLVAGCKGPCERAVDRTIECTSNAEVRQAIEEHRSYAVKVCEPFEDEAARCLKERSCATFLTCMERATARLRMEVGRRGTPPTRDSTGQEDAE